MNRIREYRIKRGLTQRQLARRALCSLNTLQNWEVGRTHPSVYLAQPLAKALDASIEELFPLEGLQYESAGNQKRSSV